MGWRDAFASGTSPEYRKNGKYEAIPPSYLSGISDLPGGGGTPDPATEQRRQRALELLAANSSARYALVTDLESDPEAAIIALAIRGKATCELRIPRDKYDGVLLLDLIERHCGTFL